MSERWEPRSKFSHDPALDRYKKAWQDMHPRFSEQQTRRRSARATTSTALQYREGGSSSSSNTDIDKFRMEPRDRKRKSTDRGSDDESSDGEQENEEEEPVPLVQHSYQPGQGMHFGLLEVHAPDLPNYVARVDYRGKGMTKRARDQRRIDPRCLQRIQYDHRFHTMFLMDFYTSVILTRNLVIARSQWIDWQYVRELQKSSINHAIAI